MKPADYPSRWIASLLRLFFRWLYHEFAWTYDAVADLVSIGLWKQWIFTALPYLPGPRVLELGHGPGHLQLRLIEQGVQSVGLDRSWWMCRIAKRRLKSHEGHTTIVQSYAQYLPFSSSSFNQVVATFPPEFILQPQTLEEIYRVLVWEGSLVVLPAAWFTSHHLFHRLGSILFQITGQTPPSPDSAYFTGFLKLITESGFDTQLIWTELDSSRVAIILAEKHLLHQDNHSSKTAVLQ